MPDQLAAADVLAAIGRAGFTACGFYDARPKAVCRVRVFDRGAAPVACVMRATTAFSVSTK